MASPLQVCTQVIATRNGLGSQTCTEIRDRNGDLFVPLYALWQGGYAAANVLTYSPSFWHWDTGFGSLANGGALGSGDVYQFAGKIGSGASAGRYCVMDTRPDIFFGGAIDGLAYISATGLGTCELTWDLKNRDGDSRIVTFFGGTAALDVVPSITNGVQATTGAPVGLITLPCNGWTPTFASATGAGSGQEVFGFDAKDSERGMAGAIAFSQSTNARALLRDRIGAIFGGAGLTGGTPIVSAWGGGDYTIAGVAPSIQMLRIAFSGTDLIARAGVFEQGQTLIDLGINPDWIEFLSDGTIAGTGFDVAESQLAVGWTDRTRQASYWTGETVNGNGIPLQGARYLSDSTIIRMGTAAAGATAFTGVGQLVSVDNYGTLNLTWPTDDGVKRQVAWFAVGVAPSPPPPPPPGSNPICLVPLPAPVIYR